MFSDYFEHLPYAVGILVAFNLLALAKHLIRADTTEENKKPSGPPRIPRPPHD
jgi:hypothetical protein